MGILDRFNKKKAVKKKTRKKTGEKKITKSDNVCEFC
jgi:hypothetical protein